MDCQPNLEVRDPIIVDFIINETLHSRTGNLSPMRGMVSEIIEMSFYSGIVKTKD